MSLRTLVNFLLAALAFAAIAIGLMIFLVGPHDTGTFIGNMIGLLTGVPAYSSGLEHPNTDSEMRFYSVYWFGFGVWILSQLRQSPKGGNWVFLAIALFWFGGVGRILSIWQTGLWPEPLFQILMWIELLAPPVVLALHVASDRSEGERIS